MSKKEKNKNPNRKSPLIRVISIISILLAIALIIKVIKIDILPLNFEITILGAVLLLTLILFIFYNFTSHSKIARVFGGFMIIVVTLSYGLGYFYLYKTAGMLSTISTSSSGSGTKLGSLSDEMTNNVSVIVMKSSNYSSLKDLSGKKIGTTSELDTKSTEKSLDDIKKTIDFDQEDYPNYYQEMTDLYDGTIDAVVLDESSRGLVYDIDQFQDISQVTKVVHTTSYKTPREHAIVDSKHPVDVTKDPFTIYFSGNDSFGNIQETGKLTHTGLYGVQTTISTIEDFMDIDINYYVRVNFSSLTNIVDAIGGVDVNVGQGLAVDQFYTDGTVGGVVEGENHLDGQKALAYARERYSYEDGDMQRVKNQQQVLKAIIKKVKSPSMLLNYTSLIDAIGSAIETNMPSSSITNFVKFQLASNSDWKFESYPMIGDTGMEFSPSLGDTASVTYQDRGSIETAHDKIEAILNGENASSVKDKAKQLDDSDVTGDDDSQAQTGTGSYQDYTQSAETYVPDDSQDSSYEDQTTYDDSSSNQGYDDSYSDYGYGEY